MRTRLHRNVWVTSATSFLTDVSSEMILNVLPLFLANVLGVRVWAVGAVEGLADTTAAIVKLYSGWLSDRLGARKWLAVAGYAISTAAKPFYLIVSSWAGVAAIRWGDRVGKGVRTAPRDALLADSSSTERRGLVFGIHRGADTAGAVLGLLVTLWVVDRMQGGDALLADGTFRTLVLWSLVPAVLAVAVLAVGAADVPVTPDTAPDGSGQGIADAAPTGPRATRDAAPTDPQATRGTAPTGPRTTRDAAPSDPQTTRGGAPTGRKATSAPPKIRLRGLGRGFGWFVVCSVLFELGNSADAFLVLRAQERGLAVSEILGVLIVFNVVYALVAAPAGALSDRVGRKGVLLAAWGVYCGAYVGFALAETGTHVALLYVVYAVYHGMVAGAAKALVSDLVPARLRALAYGGYAAAVGVVSLPASILGGVLWEGFAGWEGFGAAAPFWFGATMSGVAAALLVVTVPERPVPGGVGPDRTP